MTPVDRDIVQRKLRTIQAALLALESAGPITLESYRRDLWRRKGTERLLQEAIEASIDIATHLLVEEGRPVPADFFSSFIGLVEVGALDEALAHELALAAGLRYRLVHEYDELDDGLVLKSVGTALALLPRFIAQIELFVRKK